AGSLGWLRGGGRGSPVTGVFVGAILGALIHSFIDVLKGHRFMNWLRHQHSGPAPRGAGYWGEVGYLVERTLRSLEEQVSHERMRLDHFLSAMEASPNGVMLLDENDQIVWCNSGAADHFGLDPQRDRLQAVTNLVRAPIFVAYMQAGVFDESVSFPGPGSRGTVSVLIRTYGDGMKLILSQDITERERNDSMRRGFVANVSHEIRTPLTVLSGFIETMGSLQLTDVERRRVIELMAQQAQRMQHLVGDLLTLAQLEGSPRPASDKWVSVHQLLTQVHASAEALSAGRHTLVCSSSSMTETSGDSIAGAEQELHSAIANLVNNAIRYTPTGGSVRVTWSIRSDGLGEVEVRDTGIGIAREHLPRLTERFYRVDGSRSRDTGGTGLGLSIVKHVVQRHGGELEISSEPGHGSCFKLIFPAARVRSKFRVVDATETEVFHQLHSGEGSPIGMP
ncbi:MAG: phosphate regulon sensor histidine kinase PhoR, partial [Rhodocyclaceae bacterium]|nr:phosphate regulon sensor histidine kinase PhoR [Rhodocyclaceae bacterium]